TGHFTHDALGLVQEPRVAWPAAVGNARGDDGIGEALARGDPDAAVIEKCALALLGCEKLIGNGIINQSSDDLAFALQTDRDGEERYAVQEIRRAVEWVDDPPVGLVSPLNLATLLH